MDQSRQIEGFFISFSPVEMDIVREWLEVHGYEPGNAGIREMILDTVEEPGEERKKFDPGVLKEYIAAHPQEIIAGIDAAVKLTRKIFKK